ncbi:MULTISPECIES: hypothetical protein [unclassified Streptomyces]|uniref:hypothetical protein n=1 Tax=unclassified Streptomyces TaxID=2593676 RepID=UPI003822A3F2
MPAFDPLRVRGSGRRLRRALLRRRRATAAGLAMTAAALAATGAGGAVGAAGATAAADARTEAAARAVAAASPPEPARQHTRRPAGMVSAPVRIADAATVRLLRRGDRVDVIAAAEGAPEARVVAMGVRVAAIPRAREPEPDGGALIVLSVPRDTATALAGAGPRLSVTLC